MHVLQGKREKRNKKIQYSVDENFKKIPKKLSLSNDNTTQKVTIYEYDDEEKLKTLECGISFDTDSGFLEEAVTYTKIIIKWDDGTSDSFDCDITFQPYEDIDCLDHASELKNDIYSTVFGNKKSGEYKLSSDSKELLDKMGFDYDLGIVDSEETIFEINNPEYDIAQFDLFLKSGGKTYILSVQYSKYKEIM